MVDLEFQQESYQAWDILRSIYNRKDLPFRGLSDLESGWKVISSDLTSEMPMTDPCVNAAMLNSYTTLASPVVKSGLNPLNALASLYDNPSLRHGHGIASRDVWSGVEVATYRKTGPKIRGYA